MADSSKTGESAGAEPSGSSGTSSETGQQQPSSPSSSSSSSGTTPPSAPNTSNLIQSVVAHYSNNITDALLMITRICTILFTFLFLLPFGGGTAYYKKVLIANAATSALRLHQRLPRFQMTAAFLNQLVAEDSCHYLLYSVIFLAAYPITLVLVPLALFATLHVAFSTLTLLDKTGNRNTSVGGLLSTLIERHQRNVLQTVAMAEVLLMPFVILSILTGVCSLVTPFIYSRFLIWRYSSRRNPYTRSSFRQIRLAGDQLTLLPACPPLIRRAYLSLTDIVSRMAPAVPADGQ